MCRSRRVAVIIDCDGSTWGARTAVAVDLVVLRCSSGAATYRVRAAKVRMYNARRVCAVRVAAALEHYKICHVWLPTSRKTACRVRLRSNSIARPVSSCFRLTYCYRSTVKWLYGGSIHTQSGRTKHIPKPQVSKSQGPVDVSPRRGPTCRQCDGGISCSVCPCIKVAPSLSNSVHGFRNSYLLFRSGGDLLAGSTSLPSFPLTANKFVSCQQV